MTMRNKAGHEHRKGRTGAEGAPPGSASGGRNTWLGDSEQVYDRYSQETYSPEDYHVRRGHRYRYEGEYPPQDQDKDLAGFSLGRRAGRLKKVQEPAEREWGDELDGRESGYDPYGP